jgi:hypothetical protein
MSQFLLKRIFVSLIKTNVNKMMVNKSSILTILSMFFMNGRFLKISG